MSACFDNEGMARGEIRPAIAERVTREDANHLSAAKVASIINESALSVAEGIVLGGSGVEAMAPFSVIPDVFAAPAKPDSIQRVTLEEYAFDEQLQKIRYAKPKDFTPENCQRWACTFNTQGQSLVHMIAYDPDSSYYSSEKSEILKNLLSNIPIALHYQLLQTQDYTGKTPLHMMAVNGFTKREVYSVVLDGLSDAQKQKIVNMKDAQGCTAFHWAAETGQDIHKLQSIYPTNLNEQDVNGNTALHLCILANHPACHLYNLVRNLEIDVTIKNADGKTLLDLALKLDSRDLNYLLLDLGAQTENQELKTWHSKTKQRFDEFAVIRGPDGRIIELNYHPGHKEQALIIFPTFDDTLSAFNIKGAEKDNLALLSENHNIRFKRVGSVEELVKVMYEIESSIDFLIIGGHGPGEESNSLDQSELGLELGDPAEEDKDRTTILNAYNVAFMDACRRKVAHGGSVAFNSCALGARELREKNLPQALAREIPLATVYATTRNTSSCRTHFHLEPDAPYKVTYKSTDNKKATVVFRDHLAFYENGLEFKDKDEELLTSLYSKNKQEECISNFYSSFEFSFK